MLSFSQAWSPPLPGTGLVRYPEQDWSGRPPAWGSLNKGWPTGGVGKVSKRIAVLGGGPAGYVAAIRAAQRGARVTLVEEKKMGGTCLNVGCIPTKSLLESARRFKEMEEASRFGIELPTGCSPTLRLEAVMAYKEAVVSRLVAGIEYLMNKNQVRVVSGRGRLVSPTVVAVESNDGAEVVEVDAVILAPGSEAASIPGFVPDGRRIVTSTEALSPHQVPASLLVIGGGVVGVELATVYRIWGAEVTVVELMPQLLPGEDEAVARQLERSLKKLRINVYTSARARGPEETAGGLLRVVVETPKGPKTVEVEQILVAVGRKPRVVDLGLEGLGLVPADGLKTNERMETGVDGLWAAGDVTGGYQLAHVAFREGEVAAENAMGLASFMRYDAVPRCIFTMPEIGSVGMTEAEARERYPELRVGQFPFSAVGKAQVEGKPDGFVKVIASPEGTILGVSIIGPHAAELVSQAAVAVHLGAGLEDLAELIVAHPTLSEGFKEALLAVEGRAVHI